MEPPSIIRSSRPISSRWWRSRRRLLSYSSPTPAAMSRAPTTGLDRYRIDAAPPIKNKIPCDAINTTASVQTDSIKATTSAREAIYSGKTTLPPNLGNEHATIHKENNARLMIDQVRSRTGVIAVPNLLPSGLITTVALNPSALKMLRKPTQMGVDNVHRNSYRDRNSGNRNLTSHKSLGVKDCHQFVGLYLLCSATPQPQLQRSGTPGQLRNRGADFGGPKCLRWACRFSQLSCRLAFLFSDREFSPIDHTS